MLAERAWTFSAMGQWERGGWNMPDRSGFGIVKAPSGALRQRAEQGDTWWGQTAMISFGSDSLAGTLIGGSGAAGFPEQFGPVHGTLDAGSGIPSAEC
ncbi:MAG TPA: hypothetical protein VGL71_06100 [Urbifossiella sp.]|jgi:hypothetical protein